MAGNSRREAFYVAQTPLQEEQMAVITQNRNIGLDIRALNFSTLHNGQAIVTTLTTFVVSYNSGDSDQFRGTGFVYNALHQLAGGTVNVYGEYDGSIRATYVSGI